MRLAVAAEWAGQRMGAVGADTDCGLGAVSQRVKAGLHPPRHLWQQRGDWFGDVGVVQQSCVVVVATVVEAAVDVCKQDPVDWVAGGIDHPVLDCAVDQVIRLDPGRRFDLGEDSFAMGLGDHVGAHQHLMCAERRLEQGRARRLLQMDGGFLQGLLQGGVAVNQDTAGIQLMCNRFETASLSQSL